MKSDINAYQTSVRILITMLSTQHGVSSSLNFSYLEFWNDVKVKCIKYNNMIQYNTEDVPLMIQFWVLQKCVTSGVSERFWDDKSIKQEFS